MRARKSSINPKLLQLMKELDKTRRRENRRLPKNSDFPETTWMILKATQISKKKGDNNSKDKVLFITNTNATKFTKFTTRPGLPYFTNYYIHDYKTSETAPKHLKDRNGMLTAQIPLTTDKKKAT
jgi:hypothetical protein